ncbi:MAG: hypothetical protein IPK87_17075 [Planctomycetes bacterium]|nr:hypothetical protein [Planctomycetota bacterium]
MFLIDFDVEWQDASAQQSVWLPVYFIDNRPAVKNLNLLLVPSVGDVDLQDSEYKYSAVVRVHYHSGQVSTTTMQVDAAYLRELLAWRDGIPEQESPAQLSIPLLAHGDVLSSTAELYRQTSDVSQVELVARCEVRFDVTCRVQVDIP